MKDSDGLLPMGGIHYWGNSAVSVVFSIEQAHDFFMNMPPQFLALCIDVPRAHLCSTFQDAIAFYNTVTT